MILALSGTPGTGKSTISNGLRDKGFTVLDINKIAKEQNLLTNYDPERDTYEVDLPGLSKYLKSQFRPGKKIKSNDNKSNTIFLEGHIAHLIDSIDYAIILRCHPSVLEQRLKTKEWSLSKIRENLEAEACDVITIEAVERLGENKVFEVDTSNDKVEIVIKNILDIIKGDTENFQPGNIDWSEEILKWY